MAGKDIDSDDSDSDTITTAGEATIAELPEEHSPSDEGEVNGFDGFDGEPSGFVSFSSSPAVGRAPSSLIAEPEPGEEFDVFDEIDPSDILAELKDDDEEVSICVSVFERRLQLSRAQASVLLCGVAVSDG